MFNSNARTGHGMDHPSCPESSKYVRGWNHPCGMLLYPTDKYGNAVIGACAGIPPSVYSGKTKMYYMCQTDIKGYLPTSVVESTIPTTMINFFKELQAAIGANMLSSHK